jgi:hypothetical protein
VAKVGESKVGENEIVRWLCYITFFVCFVMMMAAITFNGRWLAPAIGTAVMGFFTYSMYAAEQARQDAIAAARTAAQGRPVGGGRERFDFGNRGEQK